MTRSLLLYLGALFLASGGLGALAAEAGSSFSVRGVVVQNGTNQPLHHVHVSIFLVDHPDKEATVTTSEDGRFNFTDVPAGKFNLTAEFRGTIRFFQQDGPFSTGIAVGPGLDSEHIIFPLPAATTLKVRVIDEEGEAVRGAQVILFHKRIFLGWSRMEQAALATTNADGSCSLPHLEAGTYFAAASGTPWYARQQNGNDASGGGNQLSPELDVAYPVTYYQAGQDPAAATPIVLTEGQRRQVEILLRTVPTVRIAVSGLKTSGSSNVSQSPVVPRIEALGPEGMPIPLPGASVSISGTEGVVAGVAPGNYRVSFLKNSIDQKGRWEQTSLGALRVSAGGNIQLEVGSAATTSVSGRLLSNERNLPQDLALVLVNQKSGGGIFCQVKQDGSFACGSPGSSTGNIAPGVYLVRLFNSQAFYIKSLEAKGATFTAGLLTVPEGASIQLSVSVAQDTAKVSGVAMKDGHPVSGAMILFVPERTDPNVEMPRDQTDSDGTFTVLIHPGRYDVIAIDSGRDLEYHNPAVLKPYLAQAHPLEFPQPANAAIQVVVQPRK